MKRVLMTVAMILGLAMGASAADLPVFPVTPNGPYDLGCQDAKAFRGELFDKNVDSFSMIFVRENGAEFSELATVEVDAVTGIARLVTTVDPSAGDIRVTCFAMDRSGNRSLRSSDSFLVDRTAPEAPTLVP